MRARCCARAARRERRSSRSRPSRSRSRAEVCVIGSGAGGAVVAAELARGGLDVVVFEQGHHWTSRDFTQREDQMLPRLFEEAGHAADRGRLDHRPAGPERRRLDGPQPLLRVPHARTRSCALWRDEHGLPSLTRAGARALLRAGRAHAQGQADPRGRGERAQPDRARRGRRSSATRASSRSTTARAACSRATASSAAPTTRSSRCS